MYKNGQHVWSIWGDKAPTEWAYVVKPYPSNGHFLRGIKDCNRTMCVLDYVLFATELEAWDTYVNRLAALRKRSQREWELQNAKFIKDFVSACDRIKELS